MYQVIVKLMPVPFILLPVETLILHIKIGLKLLNKLHELMHCKIGLTYVYNGTEILYSVIIIRQSNPPFFKNQQTV